MPYKMVVPRFAGGGAFPIFQVGALGDGAVLCKAARGMGVDERWRRVLESIRGVTIAWTGRERLSGLSTRSTRHMSGGETSRCCATMEACEAHYSS